MGASDYGVLFPDVWLQQACTHADQPADLSTDMKAGIVRCMAR